MKEKSMLEKLISEKLISEKLAFEKIMAIANIGQHANNSIGDDKIKHSIKARRLCLLMLIIALPPKN